MSLVPRRPQGTGVTWEPRRGVQSEPAIWGNRAAARIELGKWRDAAADAERAVELDGQNAKWHFRKAQALRKGEGAKEAAAKACLLSPDDPKVQALLGSLDEEYSR
eukprot:Hpha_TRINITY_DN4658_c0_g1::TRINITY_DN4658_c0_g1_i1::g.97166::m.97166